MAFGKGHPVNSAITVLLITFALLEVVISIKVEDIAEPCLGNFITQDYNSSWDSDPEITKDVTFFIPFTSKYNVFVLTQNMFQAKDFKLLTESQLENSCLVLNRLNWDLANVTAYDSRTLPIRLIQTDIPRLFRFHLPFPDGGLAGYASIALTDNETYKLWDYCFDNGLRAFSVIATSSFLDEITLSVVQAHVKSLGFKEKNFVFMNYASCFDTEGKLAAPNTEDLPKPAPATIQSLPRFDYLIEDNYLYPSFFFKKK